jgi:ketosteroid isomerase-like protein
MASASEVARASVDAFLKHDQEALGDLLAPDLEWLENGLPHEQHSEEQEGRGSWEGAHDDLDVTVIDVASTDDTAVLEFEMSHGQHETLGCAIFKIADGKVKSAHWYGDPKRAAKILWPEGAAA